MCRDRGFTERCVLFGGEPLGRALVLFQPSRRLSQIGSTARAYRLRLAQSSKVLWSELCRTPNIRHDSNRKAAAAWRYSSPFATERDPVSVGLAKEHDVIGDVLQENHILNCRAFFTAAGFSVILTVGWSATMPAFALDPRTAASLRRLDLDLRLEQICDIEAMDRIRRESTQFRPDRAKSDVISHPQHLGDTLKAGGAAFRSGPNWYAFSFVCSATPDHMKVTSFSYTIGEPIPRAKWEDYSLWR